MFNRDKMMTADHQRVAQAAVQVIDRLQVRFPSEIQVLGAATVLVLLAAHFGVRPSDVFDAVDNMRRDVNSAPEFQAVQMYIEREIAK
jgi:hypothetical protein